MKKKIALVVTSLLILTVLLTTPNFMPLATAPEQPSPGPGGIYHWKIMLAQKGCNAWITGYLTRDQEPLLGTDFELMCICGLPEPQPLGQFVFWKVPTDVVPNDIHYIKYIDYNKDGTPDLTVPIDAPFPNGDWPDEPHTWYQHLEEGVGPFGPWMVVVEVREQPYDETRPYFEWQIMMKTHGVTATLTGYLTKDQVKLPGTDFNLASTKDPDLRCQVVRTPYCTVPNDIYCVLTIDGQPVTPIDQPVTQFPWTYEYVVEPGMNVTLELTEVQMYTYTITQGWLASAGQLNGFPPWEIAGWEYGDGVPYASRAPYSTPFLLTQNITFTQRDPITGIVKLGIPAESYVGLDHIWYSYDVGTFFRSQIFMESQGCGWLYTGIGKDPILGAVDYYTFNNYTGVYLFGADDPYDPENNDPSDDVLLAGTVEGSQGPNAAGSGPPIGPCLQQLRGPDDIPGTEDDPIGFWDPNGPNPAGSSIMYLPSTMKVTFWDGAKWALLFQSPWPQLLTTGTAFDIVNEPYSALDPRNAEATFPFHHNSTQVGQPWEFRAGIDHPEYDPVPWEHKYSNAYVKYGCAWSVLGVFPTELGNVDILFEVSETKMREDCALPDIKGDDEEVKIFDIRRAAKAYDQYDEGLGDDGLPFTADDKLVADPLFDGACDPKDPRGYINIFDIRNVAKYYGMKLTPDGIIIT